MKPFKFRIWDKYQQEFIRVDSFFLNIEGILHYRTLYDLLPVGDIVEGGEARFEISYSIGLPDKTGEEIYSDDIVRCYYGLGNGSSLHLIEYCARFDYPAFELHPRLDGESNGISYFFFDGYIKIVGNKYQNPELLEKIK